MSDYNQAKYETLSIVDELEEVTSRDIADLTDRTIYNASMNLSRYHKNGFLNRYKLDGVYYYSLSKRGIDRLAWLEEEFNEDEFMKAAIRASRKRCLVKRDQG